MIMTMAQNKGRTSPNPNNTVGQPTQICPECDGSLPAEALSVSDWLPRVHRGEPRLERKIAMTCIHCGAQFRRTETRPL